MVKDRQINLRANSKILSIIDKSAKILNLSRSSFMEKASLKIANEIKSSKVDDIKVEKKHSDSIKLLLDNFD